MTTIHDLLTWIRSHPAESYIAASVALNLLVRLRVVQRLESTRAGAAFFGLVRALGIDPVAAIQTLAAVAGAKAAGSSETAKVLLSAGGVPTSLPPPVAVDVAPPTPRNDAPPAGDAGRRQ
jgi:hypothetical protein